jgi:uridine kinase
VNYKVKSLYNSILNRKLASKTMLIGIDGGGGAGKSTFAELLKEMDPDNVTVIHMDDFYKTSDQRERQEHVIGGLWDCDRIKNQVLIPLSNNQPTRYQIYDWDMDKVNDWHDLPAGGVVVIEGCYSLIEGLNGFYHFKIWIETPHDLRLSRGVDRDGIEKRYLWEDLWMPAEDYYVNSQKPIELADLVIDGVGDRASIENLEVNVLRMGTIVYDK